MLKRVILTIVGVIALIFGFSGNLTQQEVQAADNPYTIQLGVTPIQSDHCSMCK